ncbi:MAG TPA: bifunctional precorrin-2 dehydrogenase/sirohydrochlorin ferrochelatase, partial [Terriglobales bacterium]
MALFPMFLKLSGRKCIVVGGGRIAEEKITSLLNAEAEVTVIAPSISIAVRQLASLGSVALIEREFLLEDLGGAFLVVAATSKSQVNRAVYEEAQRRGVLCNAVDDPENCDFYFPAVAQRGALQIAISTAGESPALAQRLRAEIEEELDSATGDWLALLGEIRREVLATVPPGEERR